MLRVSAGPFPRLSRVTVSASLHMSNGRGTGITTVTVALDSRPPPPPSATTPRSRTVREVRIPVPWGHIAGKWWGPDNVQPVLLLHGWQDNAGSFDNLVPLLDNEALFAIDLVGHGLSSHYLLGQCCHCIDALVNLRRVVKHFKWEKVSFIGHSVGSALAYSYAACYPNGVDKFASIEGARAVIAADRPHIARDLRMVIVTNLMLEEKLGRARPKYKYDEIIELYLKGIQYSTQKETIKPILDRGITKTGDMFCFARDPRVKVISWSSFCETLVEASALQIQCDVLNVRAIQGFTTGEKKQRIYNKTLDILEQSAHKSNYHEVQGRHYVHLSNPELVAPLINIFFEKKTNEANIY